MNRVFNKVFFGFLSILFICNSTQAIEAEFKNSLVKVDLIKVNENAYDVNLYTQNKYQEPVKIIKKSDLNYYILLPETKNSVTKTSFSGSEIRNITTDLYPYAGQDVNNGYTKININTTKPLRLNVNVRNVAAASKIATHATESALANTQKTTQIQKEEKVQKKNLVSSDSKTQNTIKKEQVKQTAKPASLKPKIDTTISKEPIKTSEAIKKELEAPITESPEEITAPEEVLVELDENKIIEDESAKELLSESETKEIEQIANDSKDGFLGKIKEKLLQFNQNINIKLNKNGLTLLDLILMCGAALLTFIIVFKILSKRNEQTARLKSRADLIDKEEMEANQSIKVNTKNEPKNDGQYFVFDKNIKQTGFCDPATSAIKRNYELSSYEPELKDKYNRSEANHSGKHHSNQNDNEYDIIQKILKEDSFIDITADEYKEAKQVLQETPTPKATQAPIKPQRPVAPPAEPTVLSSVEIAPERGFMCVSYNDNINLMGYIFDDVFPLYNFKIPKLENYDIKFRLSEKDDKGARFIVKIAGTKMLIRVTKSSMNTEVLL